MSALRTTQTVATDLESRPSTRDNKKLGIFKRWAARRIANRMTNNNNNNSILNNIHSPGNVATTTAVVVRSSAQSSSSQQQLCRRSSSLSPSLWRPSPNSSNSKRHMMSHEYSSPPAMSELFLWLETSCPHEILPLILAYTGPQVTSALSRTNKFWYGVTQEESTWRTMCEELYKWKEGEDEVPDSWKDFYKYNPCVPIDYRNVHSAMNVVEMARNDLVAQPKKVRVLLRPGRYILREAITIQGPSHSIENSASTTVTAVSRSVAVELETMQHFPEVFYPTALEAAKTALTSSAEPEPSKKRKTSIRNILQCRTVDVEDRPTTADLEMSEIPADMFLDTGVAGILAGSSTSSWIGILSNGNATVKRATLQLRTRRHNEPLIRIRQGSCTIRNMELKHISLGTDIWNGNAAVQLQPPNGPDNEPLLLHPAPEAVLDRVEITSASGRGVVNIDGGHVDIRNCYVHDCAATGIYVGGPGSRATISRTDVVRNGNGNTQHRRGIARGHSGIYLEQGHASILDCNISQNSLTGISAVSAENAVLDLEESDLVSNGTYQLEMPAIGTLAHRNSTTVNNNLASVGMARSRSGLVQE